jgi:hypothetical protein
MINERVIEKQIEKSLISEKEAFNSNNPNWLFHQGVRFALEWVNSSEYKLTLDEFIAMYYGKD